MVKAGDIGVHLYMKRYRTKAGEQVEKRTNPIPYRVVEVLDGGRVLRIVPADEYTGQPQPALPVSLRKNGEYVPIGGDTSHSHNAFILV